MRIAICALAGFLVLAVSLVSPAAAQSIDYGDDSSDWARDGECDDRRFAGPGMAASLGWRNVGRDASDCAALVDKQRIALWDFGAALAATQCTAIDFGDDSSEYARDDECDDMRFEGPGMASGVSADNIRKDATDCLHMCRFGVIALREFTPAPGIVPETTGLTQDGGSQNRVGAR